MAKKIEEITQLTQEELDARIIKTEITDEMQSSYLDYAMSVIVSRALPDVRDGLKPVQRRIIYAMQDQNMTASTKFHKCAAVVGEVLKKYHPHGDTSVYEALVRMAQDFNLRYPLIFPQGNFGSIDGDPPAAMRYTECKLNKISEELYSDIDKETIAFAMNDLQNYEPTYLPSLLPNLLLNGAAGIAVGMATNVPPHNLTEVVGGIELLIEKALEIGEKPGKDDKEKIAKLTFESSANVEDLVKIIKGPDFPTGGTIYDQKEIIQMYATGKGRVVTRATMGIEEGKGDKMKLVVTEIPYMVNKSTLISKIADLVKDKKIEGISDLRDESNKQGIRIVIELKKEAVVKKIQNQLYKYTQLQNTFNANFVALLDNEPKLMTLKMILEEFVRHRQQVVVNRTIYLLKKAREREHILQGLKIALDNLDAVIALIRASKDAEVAKLGLMKKFGLSEIQAQAILDMQLRKLAALERQKIEDELKQIIATIEDYEDLLASPERIIDVVKRELSDLKQRYGDKRKTIVVKGMVGELSDEDLIIDEPCIVTISESGYIKRLKEDTYKKQGRGGKGVVGQGLKEEDSVDTIRTCSTHDWALFFTNTGRVYKMRVWDIPESSRTAKGTPLVNFLSTTQSERIQAFLTITTSDMSEEKGFVFFVTEKGVVKRTGMPEFSNIRSSGILAIKLGDGDNLAFAGITYGDDDVLITTTMGQSIRFSEKDVRDMGRAAGGVTGIKLSKGNDKVVGSVIIPNKAKNIDLLVVSDKGYGKRTKTGEYKTQSRAGSGILTYKVTDKTGHLVSARSVNTDNGSDVLLATNSGKVLRIGAKNVPVLGRATQGVRLMKLDSGDALTSAAVLDESLEEIAE
ncbi:MAG: gyrase subunit A protein [candidate division WWE3 bacterium GW2011_GWF1_42_14]|uniref:DNA gyrase subunit A n=1 Tax=candidate division WWE3 bacterium GW2011_GWF1_42_14 TaxID=1619138 RepID=A0A0G1ARB7_UNCKA|nr:MAG: gyrase subunit A protein [candidate division WWE3 bacterium GW2011_GWF1_42_14]